MKPPLLPASIAQKVALAELVLLLTAASGLATERKETPRLKVSLGDEQSIFGPADRARFHIPIFPDGTMGIIKQGGKYHFFAAGRSDKPAGWREGTYRFGTNLNVMMPDNLDAAGLPQPSLKPGREQPDPQGGDFDRDYAGGGPTIPIQPPDGKTVLLQIYHGEYHYYPPNGVPFYASLGMAVSEDDGQTFQKIGEIVRGAFSRSDVENEKSVIPKYRNFEIGSGSLVEADGYLYTVFSDQDTNPLPPHNKIIGFGLARAKKADVAQAAFAHHVVEWKKYFISGSGPAQAGADDFQEPGLGGHMTPLFTRDPRGALSFPSVAYDAEVGKFLIAYAYAKRQIMLRSSNDLIHWSDPVEVAVASNLEQPEQTLSYPTLVGTGEDPQILGRDFFIYYLSSPQWPSWPQSTLVRKRISLR